MNECVLARVSLGQKCRKGSNPTQPTNVEEIDNSLSKQDTDRFLVKDYAE